MSTLKDRLLFLIEKEEMNPNQFYVKTGLSDGFVDKASDNTKRSSLNRISNRYPQLNIEWLMTGKGEMINPGSINIVGDGNISNTGVVDGGISISVRKGGDESFILSDGADDFAIPAGLPKETYQRLVQLIARMKRVEEENEQLKKDKAILQEFVTMLQQRKN